MRILTEDDEDKEDEGVEDIYDDSNVDMVRYMANMCPELRSNW